MMMASIYIVFVTAMLSQWCYSPYVRCTFSAMFFSHVKKIVNLYCCQYAYLGALTPSVYMEKTQTIAQFNRFKTTANGTTLCRLKISDTLFILLD